MTDLSSVKWPVMHTEPLYYRTGIKEYSRTMPLDSHKMIVNGEGEIINVVSRNYAMVQHEDFVGDIINMIPQEFGEQKPDLWISDNGARMALDITFPDIVTDIGNNDPISPKLELKHSHDGHWALDVLLGAFRFRCSNGLVIGKQIFHRHKKHIGEKISFPHLKEAFKESMDNFFVQANQWRAWQDRITLPEDYEHAITTCQFGVKAQEEIAKEVETSSKQTIDELRLRTLSYWIFYNILAQYVTHKVKSRIRQAQYQAQMRKVFR